MIRRSHFHRFLRGLGREDGQALLEFTIVVPILVLLLFGILEFGIFSSNKNQTVHLASEAARAASVNNLVTSSEAGSPCGSFGGTVYCLQCEAHADFPTRVTTFTITAPSTPGQALKAQVSVGSMVLAGTVGVPSQVTGTAYMALESGPYTGLTTFTYDPSGFDSSHC